MTISKIMVAMGKTVNMGNYESVRVDYSMEANIEEWENAPNCMLELQDTVRNYVIEEVIRINAK